MDFLKFLPLKSVVSVSWQLAEAISDFSFLNSGLNFNISHIVVGTSLMGVSISFSLLLTHRRQQFIDSIEASTIRLNNTIKTSLDRDYFDNVKVVT